MTYRKYQVFVSSTFRDLAEERQDAIRNILDLKHIPAGMELFPASDTDQLEYIKKVIDECDYYLLIMGGRYGSVDEGGISFTEREYDYAVETGKIVLAFVHNAPGTIPLDKSEADPKVRLKLKAFQEKVMTGRLVKTWSSRQHLEPQVLKSLIHAFNDYPQVGWIRGNSAASDEILTQANAALQENARLREEIAALRGMYDSLPEDIADLDDEFSFKYRVMNRTTQGLRHADAKGTLSWRHIFLGVAGQLDVARPDTIIERGIKEAMKEGGFRTTMSSLNETDKNRIKVQLIALGLISARVSQSTSGNMVEFLRLTDKGKSTFMSNMVVRKPQPEAGG